MLTPNEIDKMEFEKGSFGTFKRASVEENFEMIRNNYEMLYRENLALKDKLSMLDGLVGKYKNMEESLQSAIIVAQTSADQILRATTERTDVMIKEAQVRAQQIEADSQAKIQELRTKQQELRNEISNFAARATSMLNAEIDIIRSFKDAEIPKAEDKSERKVGFNTNQIEFPSEAILA